MIEPSRDLVAECYGWAVRLINYYVTHDTPESRAYSSHGARRNTRLQCEAKLGECVFCLHVGIDPAVSLKWDTERGADPDYDVIWRSARIDVKQTQLHYDYLIWPINKNRDFQKKKFDVLALAKAQVSFDGEGLTGRGFVAGWIEKDKFHLKHDIAPAGPANGRLTPGTWYLRPEYLHLMSYWSTGG